MPLFPAVRLYGGILRTLTHKILENDAMLQFKDVIRSSAQRTKVEYVRWELIRLYISFAMLMPASAGNNLYEPRQQLP